ncbi:MAG: efflux RND transporter permease subunit [Hyphomicrobiaceae bacterium]
MTQRPVIARRSNAPLPPSSGDRRGLIGIFVRHATAPNLLMATMVLIGLFSILKLNRQFFPNIEVPTVTVAVPWPGASAEDVETNILDVLEPELRFLDDVDEVISIASEGTANISISFEPSADLQKAQSDIEQAISQVTTLPEDSERPIVSRRSIFDTVGKIAIYGPFSEQVLKRYAKDIRDGLLNAGIDRVVLTGAREEEIWVRVRENDLRRLGLSIDTIAQTIRNNTQDLPAGRLEGGVDVQLRAKSERKTPETLGEIEIRSTSDGQKIFLKDIARIDTQFDRDGKIGLIANKRAIELSVQRSLSADTIQTMANMQAYVDELRPTLPPTLNVEVYDVRGKFVAQRLGILVENGLQGLVLVLAMLFVFLNARIAFWVAAGIPIALLAALGVMFITGQTINMISMFALIMMLGIIVDDAIVVGEQTATLEEQGLSGAEAAETGARKMLAPVTAASITTMAAFMPIFFIGDRIGDIMIAIPLVVLAVLLASLIECFLILPGHLRHSGGGRQPSRIRRAFDKGFNAFRDGPFSRIVTLSYHWRYTTFAVLMAGLVLSIGLIAGGRVGFVFFPSPESENLTASMIFGAGTPREEQKKAVALVERSLFEAESRLLSGAQAKGAAVGRQPITQPDEDARLVQATFGILGKASRAQGDNLAQIDVQLVPSEQRSIPTKKIIKAWRQALPKIPSLERIAITQRRGGPPGRDVDVRLQEAPIETLKEAAEELKVALTGFPGVSAIDDDLPYGKQEYVFELTPKGTALGFTGNMVGQQVRNAFEGAIARRFARGEEEITIRVKRPQDVAGRGDLERLYLVTPNGDRVPLSEVVTLKERRSFSIVQRRDGVRAVSVTGNIDTEVTKSEQVLERLAKEVMPGIVSKYGVTYSFKGRAEERAESFKDLKSGAILALGLIYITLGWVFGSYWKPLSVMAVIPFGFLGAVLGHWVTGYPFTIISMIGLLGLSGILVNDSIVLVSRIRERLQAGDTLEEATIGGSRDRLRAVLLTSLTTIGGLTPLLFETSRQAQFLIPMAVTIVFGLAAATVLVLVLVPSLIGIGNDFGRFFGGIFRWVYPPSRQEPPATPAE